MLELYGDQLFCEFLGTYGYAHNFHHVLKIYRHYRWGKSIFMPYNIIGVYFHDER